jgi:hypothetical protein
MLGFASKHGITPVHGMFDAHARKGATCRHEVD